MSFSGEVREELSRMPGGSRPAMLAELAALLAFCAREELAAEELAGEEKQLVFLTEYPGAAQRLENLVRRLFGLELPLVGEAAAGGRRQQFRIVLCRGAEQWATLEAAGLPDAFVREGRTGADGRQEWLQQKLLRREICRRAFLRGAFLSVGSMSDPNRSYHFEITCRDAWQAGQLLLLLEALSVEGHWVRRRRSAVVYVKEGEQIARLLGLMEARKALLDFENIRILREMRGNINRQVNCETANISKTAVAAAQQIADIRFLQETIGLSELTNGLDEIAAVRLQYPTATLKELGSYLDPPIGKSGVNHRLRKLSELAEELRGNKRGVCDD